LDSGVARVTLRGAGAGGRAATATPRACRLLQETRDSAAAWPHARGADGHFDQYTLSM
jgi:hypothetical protein